MIGVPQRVACPSTLRGRGSDLRKSREAEAPCRPNSPYFFLLPTGHLPLHSALEDLRFNLLYALSLHVTLCRTTRATRSLPAELPRMSPSSNLLCAEPKGEPSGMATPEQQEQAVALKVEGNKAVAAHNWNKAIELYTKAIELNDQDSAFWSNRAQVRLSLSGRRQLSRPNEGPTSWADTSPSTVLSKDRSVRLCHP